MRNRSPGYNISFERKKQYVQSRLQIAPEGFAITWNGGGMAAVLVMVAPRPGVVTQSLIGTLPINRPTANASKPLMQFDLGPCAVALPVGAPVASLADRLAAAIAATMVWRKPHDTTIRSASGSPMSQGPSTHASGDRCMIREIEPPLGGGTQRLFLRP